MHEMSHVDDLQYFSTQILCMWGKNEEWKPPFFINLFASLFLPPPPPRGSCASIQQELKHDLLFFLDNLFDNEPS